MLVQYGSAEFDTRSAKEFERRPTFCVRSKLVDFFGDHQNGGLICIVQRHSVSQKSQQPIPDHLGPAIGLNDRITHSGISSPTLH
jgi:hypothetical protein